MIGSLITDPRAFIREQTKYRGNRTQAIIALAIGFAFAIQHIGTYLQLGEAAVEYYEVIVLHVGIDLLAPFGIWLLSTLAIAVVGRILVGRLTTGDIFRLSGWVLFPLLVSGLIQSAGRLYALRGATAPELGMYSYLGHEWEQYREYLSSANSDPVFIAATVLAIPFVLYAGYLFSIVLEEIGEEDNVEVSTRKAQFLSAIPVALCLAWLLTPFFL